jgi:hypothetical protein
MYAWRHPAGSIENADIICTATTSTKPVFDDAGSETRDSHLRGRLLHTGNAGGARRDRVSRAKVVVDSRSASLEEAGDIIQPMRAGLFDESHIHAELGEIVLGRKPGRESARGDHLFQVRGDCRAGCDGGKGRARQRAQNEHRKGSGVLVRMSATAPNAVQHKCCERFMRSNPPARIGNRFKTGDCFTRSARSQ